MPEFIPARELARLYYVEAVRPILEADYPDLAHSAGLIGPGSEVLGFDTEMSTDHGWGPGVGIYLTEADHARLAGELRTTLGYKLPLLFRGWPTHFEEVPDDPGTEVPTLTETRPLNHHVRVTTLHRFVREYAGVDLDRELTVLDWLAIPEQNLRTLAGGAVYHDGLNVLEPMRRSLAYYPHDVWLYLLSAQWQRIGQEEPFVGRAGTVGDDLGSASHCRAAGARPDAPVPVDGKAVRALSQVVWLGICPARMRRYPDPHSPERAAGDRLARAREASVCCLRDRRHHPQRSGHHRAGARPSLALLEPAVLGDPGGEDRPRDLGGDPGPGGQAAALWGRQGRPVCR